MPDPLDVALWDLMAGWNGRHTGAGAAAGGSACFFIPGPAQAQHVEQLLVPPGDFRGLLPPSVTSPHRPHRGLANPHAICLPPLMAAARIPFRKSRAYISRPQTPGLQNRFWLPSSSSRASSPALPCQAPPGCVQSQQENSPVPYSGFSTPAPIDSPLSSSTLHAGKNEVCCCMSVCVSVCALLLLPRLTPCHCPCPIGDCPVNKLRPLYS
jgi:hypothetical protein